MQQIEKYLEKHRAEFEADLLDWLRIPSVSVVSEHQPDIRRAASWVQQKLGDMGLESELIETIGHPLVYAESPAVLGKPTVLIYGHYDVQPPDPLDLWITPPFEPTIRDGNVFARGATDDKGQVLTHLESVQAWLATQKNLPVQVKFLIEGEEEAGSAGLNDFLKRPGTAERLACDVAVVSDTSQLGPGLPAITYGLRGIAYFELKITGPNQDLHSGTFGGAVMNPANALATMLSQLVDHEGRIQIPGFYDDVLPLTDRERSEFAALPFAEQEFCSQLGIPQTHGEIGYTTLERRWCRPTCDIHGLTSGYQGEGAKTVLPSRASAKFSFRLVPLQDPDRVREGLVRFFRQKAPAGISWELVDLHGAPGFVMPIDHPFMEAAAASIEKGFGRRPYMIREGGSIPIVTTFKQLLGADTLLLGWGQNDDNMHAPNEKFSIADFHRGIRSSAFLWQAIGQFSAKSSPGR